MKLKFVKTQLNEANIDAGYRKQKIAAINNTIKSYAEKARYKTQTQGEGIYVLPSTEYLSMLTVNYDNNALKVTINVAPQGDYLDGYNGAELALSNFSASIPTIMQALFSNILSVEDLKESLNEEILNEGPIDWFKKVVNNVKNGAEKAAHTVKNAVNNIKDKIDTAAVERQENKNFKDILKDLDLKKQLTDYIAKTYPGSNLKVDYLESDKQVVIKLKCNYCVGLSFTIGDNDVRNIQISKCVTPLGTQDVTGKDIDAVLQKIGKKLNIAFPAVNQQAPNNKESENDINDKGELKGIEAELGQDVMNILNGKSNESLNEQLVDRNISLRYDKAAQVVDPMKVQTLLKLFLTKEAKIDESNLGGISTVYNFVQNNGGYDVGINVPLYIITKAGTANSKFVEVIQHCVDWGEDFLDENKNKNDALFYNTTFLNSSNDANELFKKLQYWYIGFSDKNVESFIKVFYNKGGDTGKSAAAIARNEISKLINVDLGTLNNPAKFKEAIFGTKFERNTGTLKTIYDKIKKVMTDAKGSNDIEDSEKRNKETDSKVKTLKGMKAIGEIDEPANNVDFSKSILDYMNGLNPSERKAFQNAIIKHVNKK